MSQHGAYMLLLWEYYINGPILANATYPLNVCLASASEQKADVEFVLNHFFTKRDGKWHHERADQEREKRDNIRKTKEEQGRLGGLAKARNSLERNASGTLAWSQSQSQSQSQPQNPKNTQSSYDLYSQVDSAKNHAPSAPPKKGTRIPSDFTIPLGTIEWAQEKHLPNPKDQIEAFVDYWTAKVGVQAYKLDWPATFRNWLRRAVDYGGNGNGHGPTRTEQRISNNRKNILIGLGISPQPRPDEPDLQRRTTARSNPRLAAGDGGSKPPTG
jgi:uncharacterized protein YdaU (DUF1376 family)